MTSPGRGVVTESSRLLGRMMRVLLLDGLKSRLEAKSVFLFMISKRLALRATAQQSLSAAHA